MSVAEQEPGPAVEQNPVEGRKGHSRKTRVAAGLTAAAALGSAVGIGVAIGRHAPERSTSIGAASTPTPNKVAEVGAPNPNATPLPTQAEKHSSVELGTPRSFADVLTPAVLFEMLPHADNVSCKRGEGTDEAYVTDESGVAAFRSCTFGAANTATITVGLEVQPPTEENMNGHYKKTSVTVKGQEFDAYALSGDYGAYTDYKVSIGPNTLDVGISGAKNDFMPEGYAGLSDVAKNVAIYTLENGFLSPAG